MKYIRRSIWFFIVVLLGVSLFSSNVKAAAPNSPSRLKARRTCVPIADRQGVLRLGTANELVWQDRSDDETGFEIYSQGQVDEEEQPFLLDGTVDPNVREYDDHNFIMSTGYKIRAINFDGNSDYTEEVILSSHCEEGLGYHDVILSPALFSLEVGQTKQLHGYIMEGNKIKDNFLERTTNCVWNSSNNQVVTVDSNGLVTAVRALGLGESMPSISVNCNVDVFAITDMLQSAFVFVQNQRPMANDQSVLVNKNSGGKFITLTGIDSDGDTLACSIVSNPTHGTLDGTGCYKTYTPTRDYTGDDSFTFKVNDGIQDSVASTVSITVTEPPPPVPTLNSATALCIDSKDPGITLSWTDVSGEDNYEVWRSTTLDGTYSKVASPAQNATSYPDSGLTAATVYYYYVKAVNGAGGTDSGKKNATASACLPTLDVRPNSPSVSVGNATQLNAYWDKDGVDSTFSETDVTSDLNTSWSSSDISKATVSSGGSVAGVGAGSSIITASYNPAGTNRDASGSEAVTVSAPGSKTLTVTKSGTGTGTVTSSPAGIDCGTDCSESYALDTSVTLTATPTSGHTFAGWSGEGCSGTGNCVVTMDAIKTVNAEFTAPGCNPADNAPSTPSTPSPTDGATGVTPNYMTVDWADSTDADSGCDSIKYDTYAKLEPGDSWTKICTDVSASSCASLDARLENHTYYWYASAKDTGGNITDGPVWSFTTGVKAPVPDFKLILTSPVNQNFPVNILIEPTNSAARDLVSTYRGDFYNSFAGPINSFTGQIRDCKTKAQFGGWYTQCISVGNFFDIGQRANFVPTAIISNGGTTDITLSGNDNYYNILDANRGAWVDFVFCGNGAGVGKKCGNYSLPFKINEKPKPDFKPSVAENVVSIVDLGSYDPDAADVWLNVQNFRGGGKEMIILAVEYDGSIGPSVTKDKFDKCYSPVVSADDLLIYCDIIEANSPTAETPWTYTYGASGDYTIAYAIWDSLLGKGIKTKAVTIAPLEQFTLTVTDPGVSGNISGSGINCGNGGAVCSKDYTNSAEVTLTATPNTGAGYSAGSWSGDCGAGDTGINCSLTMDADKTAGANFTAPGNKTLTITDPGVGGRITSADNFINCGNGGTDCSEIYAHNTPVTLTATPNTGAGYSAGNWSGACGTGGTGTNCSLIMDADKTAGATFTAPGNKTLTITKAGTGIGTVTSVPVGIDCGADCSKSYPFGASVTLTAAPVNSTVVWTAGCDSIDGLTCTVAMTGDKAVTATFTALPAEADIRANDVNAITIPYNSTALIEWCGDNAHDCVNAASCKVGTTIGGSDISLTAISGSYDTPALTADTTYFLECVNNAGDASYDNVKITVSAQAAYILTVTKTGAGSGVITSPPPPPRINCQASCASDSASFTSGASVTLTADPTIGSAFAGWSGDADCSDGNLTMNAAKTCTATFNTRPAAINLLVPNWSFAQASQLGALKAFLKWQFSDSNLNPGESAYQLIADDDADKADPLIDTGKCSGYNNPDAKCRINLGVDKYPLHEQISLAYGQKYYWWVKVWNNLGLESSLKQYDTVPDTDNDDGDPLTFTTYKHEFPLVDFSWTPANPSRGEKVKFTDASKYYTSVSPSSPTNCNGGHCAYLWIVPADATIDNASAQNPQITFNSSGRQSVTLKVTDDDGYFTSLTKTLNLRQKLPSWREVKPE